LTNKHPNLINLLAYRCPDKTWTDKTGNDKTGNSDIGLGLGYKVKIGLEIGIRVWDRARDWYRVRDYGLSIRIGLG